VSDGYSFGLRTVSIVGCAMAAALWATPAAAGPVVVSGTVASGNYSITDTTTGLNSLDHHDLYTWQIEGLSSLAGGSVVTSAFITFNNFSNWTTVASDPYNILWMHLLDTGAHVASSAGGFVDDAERVSSFVDVSGTGTPTLSDIHDNFFENTLHNQAGWLAPTIGTCTTPGSTNAGANPSNACTDKGDTYLANTTNANDASVLNYHNSGLPGPFGTTAQTWTYNFTGSQLAVLQTYINNGNDIAVGLDSDCHFFDSSVVFGYTVSTPGVPEPTTLVLLGLGLVGAARRRWTGAKTETV